MIYLNLICLGCQGKSLFNLIGHPHDARHIILCEVFVLCMRMTLMRFDTKAAERDTILDDELIRGFCDSWMASNWSSLAGVGICGGRLE